MREAHDGSNCSEMTSPFFRTIFRVGPESLDVLGHGNNREYLRWMEDAARDHAAAHGWSLEVLKASDRAWVARQHWIEYLRPTFEGDEVELLTWVQSVRGPLCLRRYAVRRGADLLAVAATEWVFVNGRGRPVSLSEAERSAFGAVAADDARLAELGIERTVRYRPTAGL